jgi:tubulin---tyrosine ligase
VIVEFVIIPLTSRLQTPATCTNISLHNLYKGEIDLVLSGPNYGRNTSGESRCVTYHKLRLIRTAAFCLSSGTLGASLSGALSLVRSIAVSYGTMKTAVTPEMHTPAHKLVTQIVDHLVSNWDKDPQGLRPSGEVDLYSINVPMIDALHESGSLPVWYTNVWRNSYGRLFKAHDEATAPNLRRTSAAGPDAVGSQHGNNNGNGDKNPDPERVGRLVFKWGPDIKSVLNPESAPSGTDAQVLSDGCISVTPLRACFAEPAWLAEASKDELQLLKKMKL